MHDEQREDEAPIACSVIGCEATPLGGPGDRANFCRDCGDWIESEQREMRRCHGDEP